ncbi:hypothetical protein D3C84_1065860 [compost metagenome]
MTRAFLLFIEASHHVDLASPDGGEVMYDTHSDPRTPGSAYGNDLISLGFALHANYGPLLKQTQPISAIRVALRRGVGRWRWCTAAHIQERSAPARTHRRFL